MIEIHWGRSQVEPSTTACGSLCRLGLLFGALTLGSMSIAAVSDPALGTFYSVLSYGAKADGTTDDTNAINSAIHAAAAAGGGVVYFPPGTYKFTSLKFPYTGDGRGWITLLLNGTWSPQQTINLDSLRYQIIGLSSAGPPTFAQVDAAANILPNGLNPVIRVTNGPVTIKGITMGEVTGDGLVYQTKAPNPSGLNLENVHISSSESPPGTGSPLKVIGSILLRAYRCSFVAPRSGTIPSVVFQLSDYQVADHWMKDIYLTHAGIMIDTSKETPGGTTSNYEFRDFLLENCKGPFLTVNATRSWVAGIMIDGLLNADCVGAGCETMIKVFNGDDTNKLLRAVRLQNFDSYRGPLVKVVSGLVTTVPGLQVYNSNSTTGGDFPPVGPSNFDFAFYPDSLVFAPKDGTAFASPLRQGIQSVACCTPVFNAGTGNAFRITLTTNVTRPAPLFAAQGGQVLYFEVCQDARGGWNFTWLTSLVGTMNVGASPNRV